MDSVRFARKTKSGLYACVVTFKWTRSVSRERRNLVSAHVSSHLNELVPFRAKDEIWFLRMSSHFNWPLLIFFSTATMVALTPLSVKLRVLLGHNSWRKVDTTTTVMMFPLSFHLMVITEGHLHLRLSYMVLRQTRNIHIGKVIRASNLLRRNAHNNDNDKRWFYVTRQLTL